MAEIAATQQFPEGPTAGATAFGYQYLFYTTRQKNVGYWRWKLDDDSKIDPVTLRVNGSIEQPVGSAGINVTTSDEKLRVYLINERSLLTELCLDTAEGKWYNGDLSNKGGYVAQSGSVLSVIDQPVQVIFRDEDNPNFLTAAYWDKSAGRWRKQVMTNLRIP